MHIKSAWFEINRSDIMQKTLVRIQIFFPRIWLRIQPSLDTKLRKLLRVLSWHFLLCRSPISPFQSQSISIFEFPIIIFSPFLMGGLLLLKVILPFFVVALFAFSVQHVTQMPQKALFLMLLVLSDIMGLRFFFLVTDQGSWLDIGTSLSHFVIVEGTVIFLQVLFQLASFSMKLSFSKSQHITTNESSFDVHAEWNIDTIVFQIKGRICILKVNFLHRR